MKYDKLASRLDTRSTNISLPVNRVRNTMSSTIRIMSNVSQSRTVDLHTVKGVQWTKKNWTRFILFTKWTEMIVQFSSVPLLCTVHATQLNGISVWFSFCVLFRCNWNQLVQCTHINK